LSHPLRYFCFENLYFEHSILFRISDFVLRILLALAGLLPILQAIAYGGRSLLNSIIGSEQAAPYLPEGEEYLFSGPR